MKTFKTVSIKITSFVIGAAMAGYSAGAAAQNLTTRGSRGSNNLDGIITNLEKQLENAPELIATASYIGGAVFATSGVLALKQHVDNPNDKPIRSGLVRLAGGGMLLALPQVSSIITESMGVQGGSGPGRQNFGN